MTNWRNELQRFLALLGTAVIVGVIIGEIYFALGI